MRLAALLLLAALVAGCDPLGDGYEPFDGTVFVGLDVTESGQPTLRLTADDGGCSRGLFVTARTTAAAVEVEVLGIGPENACDAVIPARALVGFTVPSQGAVAVEIAHAGAVDAYRVSSGDEGPVLVAVRTSTTRPE